MKRIYEASELPGNLAADCAKQIAALEKKYGALAVRVGTHIENLANVVSMILSSHEFSEADRQAAWSNARAACSAVILDLGRMSGCSPEDAFAVAESLRDLQRHAEHELLGDQAASPEATAEAAAEAEAAIAKAKGQVH